MYHIASLCYIQYIVTLFFRRSGSFPNWEGLAYAAHNKKTSGMHQYAVIFPKRRYLPKTLPVLAAETLISIIKKNL